MIDSQALESRAAIAQALIAAGRNPSEPVAFIENGSTPKERVLEAFGCHVCAGPGSAG